VEDWAEIRRCTPSGGGAWLSGNRSAAWGGSDTVKAALAVGPVAALRVGRRQGSVVDASSRKVRALFAGGAADDGAEIARPVGWPHSRVLLKNCSLGFVGVRWGSIVDRTVYDLGRITQCRFCVPRCNPGRGRAAAGVLPVAGD